MSHCTTNPSETDNLKKCTRCGELKPATLEFFYAHKRTSCGLSSWCRSCYSVVGKERTQAASAAAREAESNWKRENPGMKRCTRCGEGKPATLEYFRADKTGKGGMHAQCRACGVMQSRRWAAANREKMREDERKWRGANVEKIRERKRQYRLANIDRFSEKDRRYHRENAAEKCEKTRLWRFENPDRVRAYSHDRRARERQAEGTHTAADIKAQYLSQRGCCWYCGKKIKGAYHVDHRVPLSRGGSNAPENIVIACEKCNLSKGSKLPHEWCGRLL